MPCIGFAQQDLLQSNLSYRRYTTNDGLPHMQSETIFQDSRGYIYIGTLSGFVRYDGSTFTSFLKGKKWNIVGFIESPASDISFWKQFLHGEYPVVHALRFLSQWQLYGNDLEMHQIDTARYWLLNNFNTSDLPPGYVLLENNNEQQRRLCKMKNQDFQIVMKSAVFDKMDPNRKLYIDSTTIYVPTSEGLYAIGKGEANGGIVARLLTSKNDIYTLHRVFNEQNHQAIFIFALLVVWHQHTRWIVHEILRFTNFHLRNLLRKSYEITNLSNPILLYYNTVS